MGRYEPTVPYYICNQQYENCIEANGNDTGAQTLCTQEDETFCGDGSFVVSTFTAPVTLEGGDVTTTKFSLTILEDVISVSVSPAGSSSTNSITGSATTPVSTSSSTSTPIPTPPVGGKSGLSSGALGAAIAVPLVFVIVFVVGLGLFIRKRKASTSAGADGSQNWGKSELHGEDVKPVELPMTERFELHEEAIGREMETEHNVHEIGENLRDEANT